MKNFQITQTFFLLGILLNSQNSSAEWLSEPSLNLGTTYNDNATFRITDELDATSVTLSAGLNTQLKEQVWDMNLDAQLRSTQYSGITNGDANNIFLKFGSNYRTELNSWSMAADFDRNTTFDDDFSTQFSVANPDLDEQTEREKMTLTPSWTWFMNESWSTQVLLQTTDVKFDEVNSRDLADSLSNTVRLLVKYVIDDVSNFTVSSTYTTTERDQDARQLGFYEYNNQNVDFSYYYKASEKSSFNISIGGRSTETTGTDVPVCNFSFLPLSQCGGTLFGVPVFPTTGSVNSSSTGNTFSFSYDYKNELSSFSMSLDRSVTTSSNGFAQIFDGFTSRFNHRLSEKYSTNLVLNADRANSIDALSNSEDLESVRAELSISWLFSKDSYVSAGYRYKEQTYSVTNNKSDSNSIYVNLSLFWPKLMSSY